MKHAGACRRAASHHPYKHRKRPNRKLNKLHGPTHQQVLVMPTQLAAQLCFNLVPTRARPCHRLQGSHRSPAPPTGPCGGVLPACRLPTKAAAVRTPLLPWPTPTPPHWTPCAMPMSLCMARLSSWLQHQDTMTRLLNKSSPYRKQPQQLRPHSRLHTHSTHSCHVLIRPYVLQRLQKSTHPLQSRCTHMPHQLHQRKGRGNQRRHKAVGRGEGSEASRHTSGMPSG